MAKKSSKPNIPNEVIERARKQAAGEIDENTSNKAATDVATVERARRRAERRAERNRGSTTTPTSSSFAERRKQQKSDRMRSDSIQTMLANPTKFVTQEELRAEYGHVVTDIRNMFALAGVLMVALVIIAQVM
mgnify:CR=1 FL=1|jgi:hypothetical protein